MRTDDLDFDLPAELIAQVPPAERTDSRLLAYSRATGRYSHQRFSDLPGLLRPGDLLVFNDARVLPARFLLKKTTGGQVEGLFLQEVGPGRWLVLLKNLGRAAGPLTLVGDESVSVKVLRTGAEGECEVELSSDEPAPTLLQRVGRMPLPPYIRRAKGADELDELDRQRYQTVFARRPGAVAAPTAALHFGPALFEQFADRGIETCFVTLYVGRGTFKPVSVDDLSQHAMHSEDYAIEKATADALNRAKEEKRRIIAVGTTSARVLESQPAGEPFVAWSGSTRIFIYPPYEWKHVSALITNFHLPRSTLVALVAVMVGLDKQRELYRVAIAERYRFFSYGDAMLLE